MSYSVKEIYFTLQGEGANVGQPAIFLRFSGCNLWSGREEDRASAICSFCDTDFVGTDGPGGGKFPTADSLAEAVEIVWPEGSGNRFVVCTGGEPGLQLDDLLVQALHERGFRVAVETNGTQAIPASVDWICVSPKPNTQIVQSRGHELKFVYPQPDLDPSDFERMDFDQFFLQPMDGPELRANTAKAVSYCLHHPQWRLSVQTHKLLGLP